MWRSNDPLALTIRRQSLPALFAALALLLSGAANAARVEIFDRAKGEVLPMYESDGRTYVVGEPGNEYEVRIRSSHSGRVLAVTSIDGVNVISGQTAAASQSGYVLEPYGFARVEGWRKSMSRTAAFYFTKLKDSYAARTGRPDNVGVIGVAVFRERVRCCAIEQQAHADDRADRGRAANASAAGAEPDAVARAPQREEKLGTGHGRSESSIATYTQFERASQTPDETIAIYYDSRRNLVARGIIPTEHRYADRSPQPFPGSFVPDP